MSPTTSLPTLEFTSLLLASIRTSAARDARWLRLTARAPPPVAHRSSQCRSLHLYITARAKTVLGMHKILPFELYKVPKPDASNHRVNLLTEPEGRVLAEGISLRELFNDHVKPGHMLYLTQPLKKNIAENFDTLKNDHVPDRYKDYAITKAGSMHVQLQKKEVDQSAKACREKQLMALKVILINLASPVDYQKLVLNRAYMFLNNGSPVEFRMRFQGRKVSKADKYAPWPRDRWPWMHDHFPHLRPDFILKSMPEGTFFLVEPFSDGRHVQFVLSLPVKQLLRFDMTKRLLKVRRSVYDSVKDGKQRGLPKAIRQQLIQGGQAADYSLTTDRPLDDLKQSKTYMDSHESEPLSEEVQSRLAEGKHVETVSTNGYVISKGDNKRGRERGGETDGYGHV